MYSNEYYDGSLKMLRAVLFVVRLTVLLVNTFWFEYFLYTKKQKSCETELALNKG